MTQVISEDAIKRREQWIQKIKNLSGRFGVNVESVENELKREIKQFGSDVLIDHLRLCGNIPEEYKHDSSEEKLYSKYTDSLLSFTYNEMGLTSIVLTEKSNSADVEAVAKNYSFVADAKVFRLSRTAKNQKDFKIQALDNWKRGKPYAMVVAPIYQLPTRKSQIYEQASSRNVCIVTYSHLSLFVNYARREGKSKAEELLNQIFTTIPALNPSTSAVDYWLAVNKTILSFSSIIDELWKLEKEAATESTRIAKNEGIRFLASEREKIMRMNREEAVMELIKVSKIDSKINKIQSIGDSNLFAIK
ncbi:MAG: HindIII family type II restriction endonuclease [Limnospira sp. PMC 1291.21]|uniref:HindIII family type II restriction endonuclease n=1 Tax=Limnospira TaxID=2596745 RepID=UPI000DC60A74|nr:MULTISPECIES: HindIII family type II restriction endonuclease [Limnospira]QJB27887.1 HindIII family type II restriction endonuclease [Limnospira fusiformis SAG 85.79]RAQ43349.1 HindIII family type II restriction endonuclease [Arthrospira sp. O9.13F]MDT9180586.1 HindIII family type II restriction endonuclease [Limnospira sp. PMC 1238.20]MDT9193043.1 HindIII family type II restriction endonuclease [Limnospira sp. PMC 1245.20]MDT9200202.1 HindIII family type II restriction endonuclease [Limnos